MLALQEPVATLQDSIKKYQSKLATFQSALSKPHHQMVVTANKIQSESKSIQAEITTINNEIASMKLQLIKDRKAIAKAKAAEHRGILETIFGVLLAPFTGGVSLILAGIGVGSIVGAEEKIHQLQTNISSSQKKIVIDQSHLSDDEKQIATLHGLTMSVDLALSDISDTLAALDSLSTSWSVLNGEIATEAANVTNSVDSKSALMSKVWFDASCAGWANIIQFAQDYSAANAPNPKRVTIGS